MAHNASSSVAAPPPADRLAGFPPRRRHLLLAGASVALIYLIGVTGKWWPTPDSALYLGLARSLANGQGYQFNGQTSNTVTPGLPMILAALRLAFGESYWAPNLFMAICGVAALALIYRAMSRLSSPRTALAAVLCCAFSYTFYFGCHRILTDAPFALLFWATICASLRARGGSLWWLLAAAALAVGAVTVRIPGVLALGPMAIGLLLDRTERIQRKRLVLLGCGLLVVTAGSLGLFYLLGRYVADSPPLYATSLRWMRAVPVLYMFRHLGLGLMAFPYAMAEMLTGQKGFIAFGLLASAWLVVGGAFSWMRGLRMPIVCVVLNVAGLAVLGGADSVRSRYLLPVLPFIAYLTIEGLMATTWVIARRVRRRPRPSAPLIAATVFVVFVLGFNAPRLLRNAVHYSYVSHTPRYYDAIRGGRHAELFPVAELLRELCPPDGRIAVVGDDTSVFHYLTERRVIWPPGRQDNALHARRVMRFLHSRTDASLAVMDMSEGPDEFRWPLRRALERSRRFKRIFQGQRWHVYRYVSAPATPPGSGAFVPADFAVPGAGKGKAIITSLEQDSRVETELSDSHG